MVGAPTHSLRVARLVLSGLLREGDRRRPGEALADGKKLTEVIGKEGFAKVWKASIDRNNGWSR